MLTERDREEIARNCLALIKGRTHIGPATCCTLLELWLTRKFEITEDDFDTLVGILHDHLEKAYDERWRFGKPREQLQEGEGEEDTDPDVSPF